MNLIRRIRQWVAELIRGCPRAQPGKWVDRDLLIVAHRGACVRMPENTIPSMETALDLERCTALETDLSMTADGEVVLWHDWDPDDQVAMARQSALETAVGFRPMAPPIGSNMRRPAHLLTLDELRANYGYSTKSFSAEPVDAHIPTLEEFLAWASTRPELSLVILDIKIPPQHPEFVPRMLGRIGSLLTKYQPKFDVVRTSPWLPIVRAMKEYDAHELYAYDVEPPKGLILRPRHFCSARQAVRLGISHATSVAPMVWTFAPWTTYRRIVHADVKIRERHNRRNPDVPIRRVMSATINEESQMACLIGIGVDALITDRPELVRGIAERLGRKVC